MFDSGQTKIGFGTPPSIQSSIYAHLASPISRRSRH